MDNTLGNDTPDDGNNIKDNNHDNHDNRNKDDNNNDNDNEDKNYDNANDYNGDLAITIFQKIHFREPLIT